MIDTLKMGGKERQLIELLKGLRKSKNIKAELIVMDQEVQYNDVHHLDVKINYLIRSNKKDLKIFCKLYGICHRFSPDIIHTWDLMTSFRIIRLR